MLAGLLAVALRKAVLAGYLAVGSLWLSFHGFSVESSQEMGSHAQLIAFKALVQAAAPQAASHSSSKFMKNMDEIPSLELSPSDPCQKALILSEQALIGKFTGLWPSPKAVEMWIAEH